MEDARAHFAPRARYAIRVPANFNADLDTSGGDISANGLSGNIKVDTSGGDLTFGQIHGDIHADTSGGDITAKNCDGATNLDTSGGRIEVTGGSGKLNVDTSGGNVTVLNQVGDAKVESSEANSASATSAESSTPKPPADLFPPFCPRPWPATCASKLPAAASPVVTRQTLP